MARLNSLTKNKLLLPFIERLLNRRHKSGETIDKSADAFVIFDENLNIVTINPLVQKLFNLILGEDVVRENISNVVPDIRTDDRNNGKHQKYIDEIRKGKLFFSDRVVVHSNFLDLSFDAEAFKVGNKIGIIFSDTAALKKAEPKTQEPEDVLPTPLDNSPDCIYIHDLKGTFLHASRAGEKLTGYKREEIIGKSLLEIPLVTPEYLQKAAQLLEQSAAGKPTGPNEFELIRKDGSRAFVEISTCPIGQGEETMVIGIARDITERKRIEEVLRESEQRLKDAMALGHTGYWEFDVDTQKISWSDQTFILFERDPSLGAPTPEEEATYYSREQAEKLREYARHAIEEEVVIQYDFLANLPSGRSAYMMGFMRPIKNASGRVVKLFGVFHDITERKKAEEALRESDERFRRVLDNSIDMIYWLNLKNGTYDYVGPSSEKVIGYTPDELIALGMAGGRSLAHPDDLERLDLNVIDLLTSAGNGNAPSAIEYRFAHKKLGYRWLFDNRSIVYDGDEPVAVVGSLRDITERKRAEEALRESEERFRNVLENSPDLIYRLDLRTGKYDYVSPSSKALLGYSPEEYRAFSMEEALSLVHPEDRNKLVENCLNIVAHPEEGWKYSRIIYRAMHREFGYRWFSDSRSVVYDDQNAPVAVIGNLRDITGYKQMEEALRQSEALFRTIFERSALGIGLVDVKGRPISINQALETILGYTIDELRSMAWTDYMHPGDATADMGLFREMVTGKRDYYTVEKRYLKKDGEMVWGRMTLSAVRDASGKFQFAIAMVEDITKSKQAEENLRESEQKFRAIFDNANEGFISVDPESRKFFNPNRKMIEMLGYASEEEMANLTVSDIHPKQDLAYILGEFEKHVRRKISRSENMPVQRKDGSVFYTSISSYPVTIANKTYLSCIFRDITERKLAEDALKVSEERYRALVDTAGLAGEGIMIVERSDDGKALIAFANEQLARTLGYTREELIGTQARNLFLPDDRIWLRDKNKRKRKGEILSSHYSVMALRKDSSMVPIEVSIGAMKYQNKTATVVYVRDISERKKAEEMLRETRDYLEKLLDHANAPIIVWDPKFKITRFNHAFEHLTGYTGDEVMGHELRMLFPESTRDQSLNEMARTLTVEHFESVEIPILRKDGEVRFVLWNSANIYAEDGVTLLATIAQGTDVTESKLALENLKKSEKYFRALIENAMEGIAIIGRDGTITYSAMTYASPSLEPLFGYEEEDLIGTIGVDPVHPDDMPDVINILNELMENPGTTVHTKVRYRHKNGSWRTVEAAAKNLLADPTIAGIVVNYRDITEQEQAHEELLRHTKHVEALHAVTQAASQTLELEELLNTAMRKVVEVMDADTGCIYLLDMEEKELVLKTYEGVSEEVVSKISTIKLGETNVQKMLQWEGGISTMQELFGDAALKLTSEALKKARVQSLAVTPFVIRGQFYGLLAIGSRKLREFSPADIDLLKAVGNQVGIGAQNAMLFEEVRALIRETLDAQEAERERICLEVHDGVAQTLVSAFQYLQTLEVTVPDDAQIKQLLAKTTTQVKQAIRESREVINSLQPATLSDLGLVATLRQEMKHLGKEVGLKVEFKADDIRLPKDIETGLYRIIHEAVSNARKHSNTKHLRIKINSENDWLKVEVKDWGKGFDQRYLDTCRRRGTGLFSIRKRAELLQGSCDIQSKPGEGTSVCVDIPIAGIKIN